MEYLDSLLIFLAIAFGFSALYELVAWLSPEEQEYRKAKINFASSVSDKLIKLPTAISNKRKRNVS